MGHLLSLYATGTYSDNVIKQRATYERGEGTVQVMEQQGRPGNMPQIPRLSRSTVAIVATLVVIMVIIIPGIVIILHATKEGKPLSQFSEISLKIPFTL